LKLYRIPGPKNSLLTEPARDSTRKVVLLQHGLFDSSDSWICNHESKSIPFILANLGWDVWLGNNRGNKYSRNHARLNPDKSSEFWEYSFHEMGKYDLPAMIEFIRGKTGKEKISYIGHSQGTAQLFSALTYNTEYFTSRLNSFVALGPVTSMENVGSGLVKIVAESRVDKILEFLNINELLNNPEAVTKLQVTLCKYVDILCSGILNLIADLNPKYDDMDRFIVFISHFPSGSSLKSVQHFSQSIRKKNFAPYKSDSPYDLKNIKNIPIGLFVGRQDLLATVLDNRNLKAALESNDVIKFYKEYDDMGHSTFFLSGTNHHVDDLLNFLEKYNK
jgi:pimeloyl-ACP methyl ester carboxylesterase